MRRILVLAKTYDGYGAEMMQIRIGNFLAEKGYEVTFCSFFDGKENCKISEKAQRKSLVTKKSENSFVRNIQVFLLCPYILFKYIRRNRFECVVTFKENPLCVALLVKLFISFTLIHSERDNPYNRDTLSSRIKMWLYRFADRIVFQTEGARDFFNKTVKKKSVLIPNFVNIPVNQWTISQSKHSIVSIGRLDIRYKRQDLLIEAFAEIHKKHTDWKLILYGDGKDKKKLEELCVYLQVNEYVEFKGKVTDASKKIQDEGIFVLTSDTEGIPNALMEAMALGMPVVSTDCEPGGARLLIKNMQNGLLVSCGDVNEIAEAISLMIEDVKKAQLMGHAARESMKEYSEAVIFPKWEVVLNH